MKIQYISLLFVFQSVCHGQGTTLKVTTTASVNTATLLPSANVTNANSTSANITYVNGTSALPLATATSSNTTALNTTATPTPATSAGNGLSFTLAPVIWPAAPPTTSDNARMVAAIQNSQAQASNNKYTPVNFTGSMTLWLTLAQSLRTGLDQSNLSIIVNNKIDFGSAISALIFPLVAASFCFLMALVSCLVVPCVTYGTYKDVIKQDDEEEGMALIKKATPAGGKRPLKQRQAPAIEEEQVIRVYSQAQRNVANMFLFITLMLSMGFLTLAYSGNIRADTGMFGMQAMTDSAFGKMISSTDAMSNIATKGLTPAKTDAFTKYYGQTAPFSEIASGFNNVNNVNNTIWNAANNTMYNIYDINTWLASYNAALPNVVAEVMNFQNFLLSPPFMQAFNVNGTSNSTSSSSVNGTFNGNSTTNSTTFNCAAVTCSIAESMNPTTTAIYQTSNLAFANTSATPSATRTTTVFTTAALPTSSTPANISNALYAACCGPATYTCNPLPYSGFFQATKMKVQDWSIYTTQNFTVTRNRASDFYVPVLNTLLTQAVSFQAITRQDLVANWSDSTQAAAQKATAAYPTAMTDVKYMLQWGKLNADNSFASVLYYNGMRSVAAYVTLTLTLASTILCALAIIFRYMKVAKAVNVCNLLFASIFWILCGATLIFAIFTGAACKEVRVNRFANYVGLMRNMTFPYQNTYDVSVYLNSAYSVRDSCYNGDNRPYVAFATKVASDIAKVHSNYQVSDTELRAASDAASFAQLMSNVMSSSKYFDTQGKFVADVTDWFNNVKTGVSPLMDTLSDISAELASTPVVAPGPLFGFNDSIAQSNFTDAVLLYLRNISAASFNPGSGFCAASWSTPAFQNATARNVSAEFAIRLARLYTVLNNITTPGSKLTQAMTNLVNDRNAYVSSVGSNPATINNGVISQISNGLVSPTKNVHAGLTEDLVDQVGCQSIAMDVLAFEDHLCANASSGFDFAFLSFLALAICQSLFFYVIRVCAVRLVEDSRWMVMAMLLKSNFASDSTNNTGVTQRLRKVNGTGTTYLEERDFNAF